MTDRAALIVNTASRRGATAYERAHAELLRRGVPVTDAYAVTDPARLRETVEQAVGSGHTLVVVGGGDGTISGVVDVLTGTGVTLGLLSLGTANDLARTLQIPLDLAAACATVADGKVVDIDVGRVSQVTAGAGVASAPGPARRRSESAAGCAERLRHSRPGCGGAPAPVGDKRRAPSRIGGTAFLNVASIGLSVEVANALSPALKRRLGPLAYPVAAVPAYRRHRPFGVELTFPDGDHEPVRVADLLQLAVGNGRFYGGGNAVSAVAGIDDHSLDVYAIPHGRFREHVNIARFFRSGSFVEHPEVLHLRTRAVDVATDRPMAVNVDGEVIATTPVSFGVAANALDVLVPQGSDAARLDRERHAADR